MNRVEVIREWYASVADRYADVVRGCIVLLVLDALVVFAGVWLMVMVAWVWCVAVVAFVAVGCGVLIGLVDAVRQGRKYRDWSESE